MKIKLTWDLNISLCNKTSEIENAMKQSRSFQTRAFIKQQVWFGLENHWAFFEIFVSVCKAHASVAYLQLL